MDIERLFQTYHDEIYGYLRRMTGDEDIAADLAQETFLKALYALGKLPPDSDSHQNNYRAWLYRIATNAHHDFWRKNKRITGFDGDENQADGQNIEASYMQKELLHRVAEVVERLPERQRTALMLYRYQELSYGEIALALQMSQEAARANVYQALQKLRSVFKEVEA